MEGAEAQVTLSCATGASRSELPVPGREAPEPADLVAGFAAEHERRYGFRDEGAAVELVAIALSLSEPAPHPSPRAAADAQSSAARAGSGSRGTGWTPTWSGASRGPGRT